jgi:type IV pilus assembly protein PilC
VPDAGVRNLIREGKTHQIYSRDADNLAVFTRQFSVMIDAGLPLVQCLDILGNAGGGQELRGGHPADAADVESGASLADAMRKHPKTFDRSSRT